MKLGVLVVYLVTPQDGWVLDMHLANLARTCLSQGSFKVYAAANRLPEQYRALLSARDFVEIVDLPPTDLRMNAEHGTLLDGLAARALADGCDHVCTFDVDSWPIRDDWPDAARGLAGSAAGAAVLRAENGDTVLPHPSFCFLKADAFTDPACRFWIPPEAMDEGFRAFLAEHRQRIDTGIGVGYSLHRRGLRWVALRRSNKIDHHYLMAGIYGDLVFHLGGGTRSKIFARDGSTWANRLTGPLASLPWLWRHRLRVVEFLEHLHEPPIYRRNRRIFEEIMARLRADETAFYEELRRGGRGSRVAVIADQP